MAQTLAPVFLAIARLLPIITFAVFAIYFMKSNVSAGLGVTLKTADVLVSAGLAGVGWATCRLLSSVEMRFDAIDSSLLDLKTSISAINSSLRDLKTAIDATNTGLPI